MSEQRVISSAKRPVGGIREGRGKEASAVEEPADGKKARKRPKKIVLIIGAVAVLVIAGAAYFFLLKPGGDAEAAPEPEPVPGDVLIVDAISINLAEDRYLRLGLGLQFVYGTYGKPDPAKAHDLAIALFSGRTVAEVSDPAARDALKAELLVQLIDSYNGEVMDVYLTDFVTQ